VAKETSSYEFTLKDAPPACGTPQTLYIRDHSRVLDFAKYAYKMTMNESIKVSAYHTQRRTTNEQSDEPSRRSPP